MKTIEFLKKYEHTATRTWEKGDTPTVSTELAARLVSEGCAKYADGKPALQVKAINPVASNARGIDEQEWEDIMEKAANRREAPKKKK